MDTFYKNFPKLYCPFIRNPQNKFLVTNLIDKDFSWFLADGVKAVDKIDGSGCCVFIQDGNISRFFNRTEEKFALNIYQTNFHAYLLEGVARAISNHWINKEGFIYGELIGETINKNRHQIKGHLFVPFNYLCEYCQWNSWLNNKYPKDYKSISKWFKDELPSLFNEKMKLPEIKAEGLVFYHPDGRKCKLRRDQFKWYKEEKKKEWMNKTQKAK